MNRRRIQVLLVLFTAVVLLSGCVSTANQPPAQVLQTEVQEVQDMKTIYLAGGCFWGVQRFFDQFDGVISTETGYSFKVISHRS